MTIQEKHISKILTAKCEIVCAASKLLDKLNYGEDIGCCLNKLISAVQLINRLECYCFPVVGVDDILSKFRKTFNETTSASSSTVIFYKNGIEIGSFTYDADPIFLYEVVALGLTSLDIYFTDTEIDNTHEFNLTMSCDTASFNLTLDDGGMIIYNYDFDVIQQGVCGIEAVNCNNCFPTTTLPKMYSVLDSFLK